MTRTASHAVPGSIVERRPPFHLEAGSRVRTPDVTEAVEAVVARLRSGGTPEHTTAIVDA
ncbi:hypothetical protein AB0N87_02300 [Streptomyces sp. NPDC093228]|jgi:hypothetical protein|uniref:hypothetical protein n=1 Tax=unclassified Streptomyces TaxID=2593676 RepID=UPI000B03CB72|nr:MULTISPECIES: hypothetical protein [unclassified Streptomyces]MDX3262781.1 hypothetical protein [Streptomyces sp. MI02-2A]REE61239.1 hypothetical protein BX257_3807 [Streptomyces sp. 3212.3]